MRCAVGQSTTKHSNMRNYFLTIYAKTFQQGWRVYYFCISRFIFFTKTFEKQYSVMTLRNFCAPVIISVNPTLCVRNFGLMLSDSWRAAFSSVSAVFLVII